MIYRVLVRAYIFNIMLDKFHILEPYWNFVRTNQVFGRAIRLKSHNDLEPSQRKQVEKYIYLSTISYMIIPLKNI